MSAPVSPELVLLCNNRDLSAQADDWHDFSAMRYMAIADHRPHHLRCSCSLLSTENNSRSRIDGWLDCRHARIVCHNLAAPLAKMSLMQSRQTTASGRASSTWWTQTPSPGLHRVQRACKPILTPFSSSSRSHSSHAFQPLSRRSRRGVLIQAAKKEVAVAAAAVVSSTPLFPQIQQFITPIAPYILAAAAAYCTINILLVSTINPEVSAMVAGGGAAAAIVVTAAAAAAAPPPVVTAAAAAVLTALPGVLTETAAATAAEPAAAAASVTAAAVVVVTAAAVVVCSSSSSHNSSSSNDSRSLSL